MSERDEQISRAGHICIELCGTPRPNLRWHWCEVGGWAGVLRALCAAVLSHGFERAAKRAEVKPKKRIRDRWNWLRVLLIERKN